MIRNVNLQRNLLLFFSPRIEGVHWKRSHFIPLSFSCWLVKLELHSTNIGFNMTKTGTQIYTCDCVAQIISIKYVPMRKRAHINLKDVLSNHHSLLLHHIGSGALFAMALRKGCRNRHHHNHWSQILKSSPNEFQYR